MNHEDQNTNNNPEVQPEENNNAIPILPNQEPNEKEMVFIKPNVFEKIIGYIEKVCSPKKIEKWKNDYGKLTIAGVDDIGTYASVEAGIKQMKAARNALENTRTDVNRPIIDGKKRIDDTVKKMDNDLKEILNHLETEKKKIDNQKETLRLQKITDRKKKLLESGFKFDGQAYIAGVYQIRPDQIEKIEDEQFNTLVANGENEIKTAEAAEKKRIEDAAAEQKRIQDAAADLAKKQMAMKVEILEMRLFKLAKIGMEPNAENYLEKEGHQFYHVDKVSEMTTEEFNDWLEIVSKPIKKEDIIPEVPELNTKPVHGTVVGNFGFRTSSPALDAMANSPENMQLNFEEASTGPEPEMFEEGEPIVSQPQYSQDFKNGWDAAVNKVVELFTTDTTPRKRNEWIEHFKSIMFTQDKAGSGS